MQFLMWVAGVVFRLIGLWVRRASFAAFMMSTKFWAVYALVAPASAQFALLLAFYFLFREQIAARMRERAAASNSQTA